MPAPISELQALFRFGMGPSGGGLVGDPLADDWPGEGEAEAEAEVTVTVSAAEGGVHFAVVTMLAVAVSVTEVTEVARDATGICALMAIGCFAGTELTTQAAVPSPLAQPMVNVGLWLDGWAASVTDTFEADTFWVETCTTYTAFCPRWTLDCKRWTLTHSSGWPAMVPEVGLVAGAVLEAT